MTRENSHDYIHWFHNKSMFFHSSWASLLVTFPKTAFPNFIYFSPTPNLILDLLLLISNLSFNFSSFQLIILYLYHCSSPLRRKSCPCDFPPQSVILILSSPISIKTKCSIFIFLYVFSFSLCCLLSLRSKMTPGTLIC